MSKPIIQRYNDFMERDDHFNHVCFADSETTGLDPQNDEMIQFCLITNKKTFIWYIHPEHNNYNFVLDKFIDSKNISYEHHKRIIDFSYGKKLHSNVNDDDMIIKYNIQPFNFAQELKALIEDQIVIMHNGIRFDAQFINNLFRTYGIRCNWACLDSMVMAKELNIPTPYARYNQNALGTYFKIPNDDAHDAYGDAKQLIRIFQALVGEQSRRKIHLDWYEKK